MLYSVSNIGSNVSRLGSLDFLRGIAILGVIYLHLAGNFLSQNSNLSKVAFLGSFGVPLFFLVSAYTMCLMWNRRIGEGNPVASFYIRRFFRIAPLFWIAMIGYIILNGIEPTFWAPNGIGPRQIILSSLFLHEFDPYSINAVVPGGWSIGIEMCFYALFPFLILRLDSAKKCLFAALSIWFLLGFGGAMLEANILASEPIYAKLYSEFFYFSLFTQLPVFLLGMYVFYEVSAKNSNDNWPLVIGIIIFWISLSALGKFGLGLNTRPLFWGPILLLSGLVIVTIRSGYQIRLINSFGEMSYSVYLIHFAVITAVNNLFKLVGYSEQSLERFALATVLVLAISWILGRLSKATLEQWSVALGRWVLNFYVSRRNRKK